MPTKVAGGRGCIRAHAEELTRLGSSALIVTGGHSAKASGALGDVIDVLTKAGISYTVFDCVKQNPALVTCHEGGQAAVKACADFVIGIGGGSPLDAAKAIAAFAVHPERKPAELYDPLDRAPLPIIAIPTTAGTGSECNTFSVLTLPGGLRKQTFKDAQNFPKLALLDPDYLISLPREFTISTALDAFCHGVESFLSRSENSAAELCALSGAKQVWQGLNRFLRGDFELQTRTMLLEGASICGAAIQHTTTCFPHPMGYNLTLTKGIAHGTATAVFLPEFIQRTEQADPHRTAVLYDKLGVGFSSLAASIQRLCSIDITLSQEEITQFVERIKGASNFQNGRHAPVSPEDMAKMYEKLK